MKGLILISIVSTFSVILGMAITMVVMCVCNPMAQEHDKDSKNEAGERRNTANFEENSYENDNEDMVQFN